MTQWGTTWIAAILAFCASIGLAEAEHKRVLIVYSFGRGVSPFPDYVSRMRGELSRRSKADLEIYEVAKAAARSGEVEQDGPFIEYLNTLFAERQLDLVITIGGPAGMFFQRHRGRV